MVQRTFTDIPGDRLADAEDRDFLVALGYRKATTWYDLLLSRRILIISEAGSGKTYECRMQCERLQEDGQAAFFLELAALSRSPVRDLLSVAEEERLSHWLSSSDEVATFFVDSIDELQITAGSLDLALKKLAKTLHGHLHRARIVITTRPVNFDEQAMRKHLPTPDLNVVNYDRESFADMAMGDRVERNAHGAKAEEPPPAWRIVGLMPLTETQILAFAEGQGVSEPHVMLDDILERNALTFAQKPQELIELCADWRAHRRIRAHRDQLTTSIEGKLRARPDRAEPCELSPDQCRAGARRLALACVLTRRLTLRHSAASDDVKGDEALDPARILTDWTALEIRTLLERPLFIFASYGRVRFHHRSVVEFLAAKQLARYRSQELSRDDLVQLLFDTRREQPVLRPSLRAVAAWMAATDLEVFSLARDHAPAVLLTEADPQSLTEERKRAALRAYVARHGQGGWRGLRVETVQAHRFASAALAPDINALWSNGIENPEVREILLELVEAGRLADCAPIAREALGAATERGPEAIHALRALIALEDETLPGFCEDLVSGTTSWPDGMARRALRLLFPEHLSVAQLLALLQRLKPDGEDAFDELRWYLPEAIETGGLDRAALRELRDGLVAIISEDLHWDIGSVVPLRSSYAVIARSLAATCLAGLAGADQMAWLTAATLAIRLRDRADLRDDSVGKLKSRLDDLNAEEAERLFWCDQSLLARMRTPKDVWREMWDIVRQAGPFTLNAERDRDWLLAQVGREGDPIARRSLALEVALFCLPHDSETDTEKSFMALCGDAPTLRARVVDYFAPNPRAEEYLQDEVEREARKAEETQRREAARATWADFHAEVEADLDALLLSDKRLGTLWSLGRVMGRTRSLGRSCAWNYHYLLAHFGEERADRIRTHFAECWKTITPPITLPSERAPEERNSEYRIWALGLAGLHAASESGGWAKTLTPDEAAMAARYVPIELNGFPEWMEDLADAHPAAVEATLCRELTLELQGIVGDNGFSPLLSTLAYAEGRLTDLFAPHVMAALEAARLRPDAPLLRGDTAYQAAMVVRKASAQPLRDQLQTLTLRVLDGPLEDADCLIWLGTLFALDPVAAGHRVIEALASMEPARESRATVWIGTLFGDGGRAVDTNDARLPVDLRLALLEQAYRHVRLEDDHRRGSGTFTPDARDTAERARNTLLSAVLDLSGSEGLEAKRALAAAPYASHIRERVLALAEEKWASEVDVARHADDQVVALHVNQEIQITSNGVMHAVCLSRLEAVRELLLSDDSPRAAWALITDEHIMRRELARALRNRSRELYTVHMESVTADEKETDIRLRSTRSDHESVIELKLGDNYSPRVLIERIGTQLVDQYLAPEARRSGVFVVTNGGRRNWRHPETKMDLSFNDLIGLLREEASRLQSAESDRTLINVFGIDLLPRL